MLHIYEYPTCTTCKKAKKLMTLHNIPAEYYNVKEKTPSVEELKLILKTFDLPLKKLFNTSGTVYKEMNLKDKLSKLTVDEALELLTKNGMLLKRPLAFDIDNDILLLGFKEVEWEHALL